MNLSDSFKEAGSKANLDLKVKVYNINEKDNHPILLKSLALSAYAKFTEYVRIGESKGKADSVGYALDRCIAENILADYFERLKREDRGMIFGEYSWEDDAEVMRQEAAEDKAVETAKNLLKETDLPVEKIAQCCTLSLAKVTELAEEIRAQTVPAN